MSLYSKLYEKLENPEQIARHRLAFLPAALEIEQSPASPAGRAMLWLLVLLFSATVTWALLGEIDIVAVAPGKVIASGKTKIIQPYDRGAIQAIHVVEGQSVSVGTPLITLDRTESDANERRTRRELSTAETDQLRELAFNRYLSDASGEFDPQSALGEAAAQIQVELSPQQLRFQVKLLDAQTAEFRSHLTSLTSEMRARQGEKRATKSLVRKYQRILPITTERVNSVEKLYKRKLAARSQYLELEQQRIDHQQTLEAERARVDELDGEIATIAAQLETARQEALKNNLSALEETDRKVQALRQEHRKLLYKSAQQVLRSPVQGTVQELAVHTVGGIVTPAQQLMRIVPSSTTIEVEAFLQNKDIGFVHETQSAAVKVDTFNFTKYGTIDGQLRTVSNDAINDEKLGLVYPTRVKLANARIRVKEKWVNLSPGMSVTVEIKTGKRRIIEFFLSPLLRRGNESIRER